MGNNPVIGVDPDGEFVHLLIGAAIGGVVNLGVKAFQGKIGGWKDGFAAFGIGAAAGVVTAATGGAASGALGLSMTSIGGGAVAGASGAVLGSPLQGLGNAAYFGDAYSGKQFLTDIVAGGVLGGVAGGTAGWIKNMKAAKVGGPLHNMITGRVVGNGRTPWSLNNSSKWNISFDDIQADFPEYVHPNGNVTKGGNHTISGNAGAATGSNQTFRSFTPGNYRYNLQALTGESGGGMDAHHIFPQAARFQQQWNRVNLNIHDPNNLTWWQNGAHQSAAKAYNKAWDAFFRQYPNANLQQIREFGNTLMKSYGF